MVLLWLLCKNLSCRVWFIKLYMSRVRSRINFWYRQPPCIEKDSRLRLQYCKKPCYGCEAPWKSAVCSSCCLYGPLIKAGKHQCLWPLPIEKLPTRGGHDEVLWAVVCLRQFLFYSPNPKWDLQRNCRCWCKMDAVSDFFLQMNSRKNCRTLCRKQTASIRDSSR